MLRTNGPVGLPSIGIAAPEQVNPAGVNPAGYDRIQSQSIPGYSSLARLSVALLAASTAAAPEGAEVLVAGCGTGSELLEALRQRPDWQLTAIDPSAEMLAESRSRVAGQGQITWRQTTAEALAQEPGVAGRYAGALSVLVLQSLPDDGSKLAFLTGLASSLQPGAQLVLVDLMQSELPSLESQLNQAWQGFQRASGLEAASSGTDDLQLHPIGLARLTSLVNAAGFGDPARIYQALDFQGFLLQRNL
jgi:tRNA (cmo5U34)-methyltransferase